MNEEKRRKKEKARKKKKFLSKLKVAVNILTSMVTLAASIATCMTVVEMQEERNQLYEPYFIIRSSDHSEVIEKPIYNVRNTCNLVNGLSEENRDIQMQIPVIIDNIGSGTAKDIKIIFSCKKIKNYVELICQYYSDEDIEFEDDSVKIFYDSLEAEKKQDTYFFYETEDIVVEKPYLFSEECMEILLPEEYSELLYLLVYCTNGDFDVEKLPTIDLEIYYEDLQGIKYHKKYELGIDIYVDYAKKDVLETKYTIQQYK